MPNNQEAELTRWLNALERRVADPRTKPKDADVCRAKILELREELAKRSPAAPPLPKAAPPKTAPPPAKPAPPPKTAPPASKAKTKFDPWTLISGKWVRGGLFEFKLDKSGLKFGLAGAPIEIKFGPRSRNSKS